MASVAQLKKQKAETEIAVLQVQVKALDEKIDDFKYDLKEMRTSMEKGSEETKELIKELQTSNSDSHEKLSEKVASLEKLRWMLLGAAAVGGAMGYESFQMLIANFVQ